MLHKVSFGHFHLIFFFREDSRRLQPVYTLVLGDQKILDFNVTTCDAWYIQWNNVPKALHLMNDSIGVGHAGLVCHLWTPHLPYDCIDFLLNST